MIDSSLRMGLTSKQGEKRQKSHRGEEAPGAEEPTTERFAQSPGVTGNGTAPMPAYPVTDLTVEAHGAEGRMRET